MFGLNQCRTSVHQAIATKIKLAFLIWVDGATTHGAFFYAVKMVPLDFYIFISSIYWSTVEVLVGISSKNQEIICI